MEKIGNHAREQKKTRRTATYLIRDITRWRIVVQTIVNLTYRKQRRKRNRRRR